MLQGATERLGPCRLLRELGTGGMGTVFLAELTEDRPYAARGARVAVKTLHPALVASDDMVRRFRREAEVGSRVVHPCVVRTFEAGQASVGQRATNYLVLEYVEGRTLRQLLEEMPVLPEPLLRHLALQIARGLQAVHEVQATHRDLKPENILVTPDHEVKVMDLGIAQVATEATRLTQSGLIVGTLAYASPEQIEGQQVGPASDLYSFGIVLYEAATGRMPFSGANYAAVVFGQLQKAPERPGALAEVTPFLEAVILRLLEKNPEDRFGSAAELVAVLEHGEQSDWWTSRETAAAGIAGAGKRIPIARGTPFVGRSAELLALEAAYQLASGGTGAIVLLEGEPGAGKTRLLDQFLSRLAAEGKPVDFLYGCFVPGGYGPGSDALSSAVVGRFGSAALEQRLTTCLKEAADLVPAFAAHLQGRPAPPGKDALSAEALPGLYGAVAEELALRQPVVWIIEDAQFAPADARALVLSLARQAAAWRVVLVVTSGAEGAGELAGTLLKLPNASRQRLGLLGADDIVQLVFDKVGRQAVAEDLGQRLADRTGGNPFFALASIADLEQQGVLKAIATNPTGSQAGLARLTVPASVRDLLERRLSSVPEDERPIVDAAAVLGYEFDPDLVARVLDTRRLKVLQSLAAIERRSGLVRAAGASFRFDHQQLQEVLYESLPDALREEYHSLAAAAYRQREALVDAPAAAIPAQAAVVLAGHLFRSGAWREARDLAVPALTQLKAEYHTGALLQLADVILDRCRDVDAALVCDVQLMRADALHMLGRTAEAREAAEQAAAAATALGDRSRLAQAKLRLGVNHLLRGELDAARDAVTGGLELARSAGDQVTAARAIGELGRVQHIMGQFAAARQHYEEQLALTRRIGERRLEADVLAQLSNLYLGLNELELAEQCATGQLEVSRVAGHHQGRALGLFNLGQIAAWKGDYGLARTRFEEQLAESRRTASRTMETLAHLLLSQLCFETGQTAEARRHAELGTDLCEIWQVRVAAGYLKLRSGDVAWAEGDRDGALARYADALAYFRATHSQQGIAEAALSLGRLQALNGQRDAARAPLEEARDLTATLRLSVPGPLPAAWLAWLGDAPAPVSEADERGRCAVVAELHLVLHLAHAPGDHAARARERLGRLCAHLKGAEAEAFWTGNPIARLFQTLV